MATLSNKVNDQPFKGLIMGNSGSGKTGMLASLVIAGYELFILDYDNGADPLADTVPAQLHGKVHIETLTDTGKLTGFDAKNQKIEKLNPQAFPTGLMLLNNWKDRVTGEVFGPVTTWDKKRVLVVDSLGFCGGAALDFVLARNGRIGQQPYEGDWGEAMRMLEQMLQILFSAEVKCHVIVNTHIDWQQPEGGGLLEGMPLALGKKLGPKIGRYFNTALHVTKKGGGTNMKRVIRTKPEVNIGVKFPILNAPAEFPIETGLADIFKLWEARATVAQSVNPVAQSGAIQK